MAKVIYNPWDHSSPCPHDEDKENGGPIKPNEKKNQCQCVMCHCGAYIDGTIGQCNSYRWSESNQFCQDCEEMHGEKWRELYGNSEELSK